MFLFKKDKPLWKRLGLHHAAIALAAIIPLFFILGPIPAAIAYGIVSKHYYDKEKRENGDKWEVFDLASPVIIGGGAIILLNYLLSHGIISYILF